MLTTAVYLRLTLRTFIMPKEVAVTDYQARVYGLLKQIPAGRVSTYAAISKALGSSPRAVGGALRRNPFAPEVPCHRVISADGVSLFPGIAALLIAEPLILVYRRLQRRMLEGAEWHQPVHKASAAGQGRSDVRWRGTTVG